jgi:hypothetical protein
VEWQGRRYTFAIFALVKTNDVDRVAIEGSVGGVWDDELKARLVAARQKHPTSQIFALVRGGEVVAEGVYDLVDHVSEGGGWTDAMLTQFGVRRS